MAAMGGERKKAGIAKNISVALADVAKVMVSQGKEIWLGGLEATRLPKTPTKSRVSYRLAQNS